MLPILSFVLLSGVPASAWPSVEPRCGAAFSSPWWSPTVGIVVSLPLGIVLALGPALQCRWCKFFSVAFIEFVRGVPLITVLFMASVMLPLFVPERFAPDKLAARADRRRAVRLGLYGGGGARRACRRFRAANTRRRRRSGCAIGG